MDIMPRIEQSLAAAVASCEATGCPPRLAAAIRYAERMRKRARDRKGW